MSVDTEIAKGYLNLGLAGAALLIILIFVILMFAFMKYNNKQLIKVMGNWSNREEQEKEDKVDKLCDKIDCLVTVINNQLIAAGKDNKMIVDLLNQLVNIGLDTQRRVVRVDDRTYLCRGNPSKDVVTAIHSKSARVVSASPKPKQIPAEESEDN